jgi:Fe-S cluster biogenesis protein NfuA
MNQLIDIQDTALRSAKRYVFAEPMGSSTLTVQTVQEATIHPVLEAVWYLGPVKKLHLQPHTLTVFADGELDWEAMGRGIARIAKAYAPPAAAQDKNDTWMDALTVDQLSSLQALQNSLDFDVRPALQKDGGDLVVTFYDGQVLRMAYQGTCRSCGFSTSSTLAFIQSTLGRLAPSLKIEMS